MPDDLPTDLVSKIGRILWLLSYPEDIDQQDEVDALDNCELPPARSGRHAINNVYRLYPDIQEAREQIETLPPHPVLVDVKAALILADEELGGEPWIAAGRLCAGDEEQAVAICREDVERARRMAGDLLKLSYAKLRAHLDEIQAGTQRHQAVLSGNRIIIGDKQIVLEPQEHGVVKALVDMGAATLPELKRKSSYKHPAKTLQRLIEKHGDILRAVISLPGGRGRGGYSTKIKLASTTV